VDPVEEEDLASIQPDEADQMAINPLRHMIGGGIANVRKGDVNSLPLERLGAFSAICGLLSCGAQSVFLLYIICSTRYSEGRVKYKVE
jgi:hypothetical protein